MCFKLTKSKQFSWNIRENFNWIYNDINFINDVMIIIKISGSLELKAWNCIRSFKRYEYLQQKQ